jgi:hypothetical protein
MQQCDAFEERRYAINGPTRFASRADPVRVAFLGSLFFARDCRDSITQSARATDSSEKQPTEISGSFSRHPEIVTSVARERSSVKV